MVVSRQAPGRLPQPPEVVPGRLPRPPEVVPGRLPRPPEVVTGRLPRPPEVVPGRLPQPPYMVPGPGPSHPWEGSHRPVRVAGSPETSLLSRSREESWTRRPVALALSSDPSS